MKRVMPIILTIPLALTACSGTDNAAPSTSSTADTSSTTTSTSSSASASSSTSSTAPPTVQTTTEPSINAQSPTIASANTEAPTAGAQPTFVSCWENGYAQLFDMSVVEWPYCALPADEASVLGPGPDPATIPYSDGGTCPAYKCGYGHDENGNPNPSNSEIQSWWSDCTATNTAEYCRANDPYQ